MVYSKKSIEVVNKLLNVVLVILILVIFYLMVSLIKKEYFMNYNNPIINIEGSQMRVVNPQISLEKAMVEADSPQFKLVNPNLYMKNPNITSIDPKITLEDPEIILNKPELTAKNARIIIDDAKILLNNPELMMTNVAITEPFNNSANNGIATTANNNIGNNVATTAVNNIGNNVATTAANNIGNNVATTAANNIGNNVATTAANNSAEEENNITTATTSVVAYIDINSNGNHVENFLAYLDEQKYCPNIYNALAISWVKFPEKYGGGYLGKFCCVSCYHLVCKEIYCGDNLHGAYVLDRLTVDDVARLKDYYDCVTDKFDFNFPAIKLNNLIGKAVLKYKFEGEQYYPIQVIKTEDELYYHEESPTVVTDVYVDEYMCELPQTTAAHTTAAHTNLSNTTSSQLINMSTSCSQVGGSTAVRCRINNNNNNNDNVSTTGTQVLPISARSNQVLPISALSNQVLPISARSNQVLPISAHSKLDYNSVSNKAYAK